MNNAGILRMGDVNNVSLEDIDATLNVNVRAPVLSAKAIAANPVQPVSVNADMNPER